MNEVKMLVVAAVHVDYQWRLGPLVASQVLTSLPVKVYSMNSVAIVHLFI